MAPVEIATRRRIYPSRQERASVAGCDTCFVTWISPLYTHYLVYPVASRDCPFPARRPRTHSCRPAFHGARERESRRCHSNIWFTVPLNRVSAAPPFFGKPSPRPNSCHGRARVCVTSLFSPLLSSRFAYLDKVWGRLDSADRIGVAFFF